MGGGNLIELHQDASQGVDFIGNLDLMGGEFKVYGGNDQSHWGYNGNATLTMSSSGGNCILDFVDQAIAIQDVAPYSFTSTITGGTIRSQKGFFAQSPGFNPTGGAVEIYGDQNGVLLSQNGGAFYNVTINKPDFSTRVTVLPSVVKNNLIIAEGLAEVTFGNELQCWNNLEVQEGGWMAVTSGTISMKALSAVNVYNNGQFTFSGYAGGMSRIKGITPSDIYTFSVNSGGTLEATFTIFETLPLQGVYIAPGAIINPYYSFTNCEFLNGENGASALMSIDSEQDIIIENAVFPTNTWGGQYNVRKIFDTGSVTFVNATGDFAGETFDDDPYNRIDWTTISNKTLNLKLYLEELYPGSGLMHKAQDASGDHFPGNIADAVTVELHNGTSPYALAFTFNYVNLNTDGTLSIPTVPLSASGSYYIVIKHRNSIETWSMAPVSFAGIGPVIYDFSTAASQAYGNNLKLMGTVYVIFGGNASQDGSVDGTDMALIDNASTAVLVGYNPEDVNGDGVVDGSDMAMVDNNSTAIVTVQKP